MDESATAARLVRCRNLRVLGCTRYLKLTLKVLKPPSARRRERAHGRAGDAVPGGTIAPSNCVLESTSGWARRERSRDRRAGEEDARSAAAAGAGDDDGAGRRAPRLWRETADLNQSTRIAGGRWRRRLEGHLIAVQVSALWCARPSAHPWSKRRAAVHEAPRRRWRWRRWRAHGDQSLSFRDHRAQANVAPNSDFTLEHVPGGHLQSLAHEWIVRVCFVPDEGGHLGGAGDTDACALRHVGGPIQVVILPIRSGKGDIGPTAHSRSKSDLGVQRETGQSGCGKLYVDGDRHGDRSGWRRRCRRRGGR